MADGLSRPSRASWRTRPADTRSRRARSAELRSVVILRMSDTVPDIGLGYKVVLDEVDEVDEVCIRQALPPVAARRSRLSHVRHGGARIDLLQGGALRGVPNVRGVRRAHPLVACGRLERRPRPAELRPPSC